MACKQMVVLALVAVCLASCSDGKYPPAADDDRITQISVINSLMIGRYEGGVPISELLKSGNFGVGTFDHLDGELIVLDGEVYQVRGEDGKVVEVGADRSTPFAVITPFEGDGQFPCPTVETLAALDARLDEELPQKNNFAAIRIDAEFASITMRSVVRQEPPYRPLAEVAKSQSVWSHENISGTLIGIRCPAWVGGLNVPGYHWHFLSRDRKMGGHVLDCRIREGRVRYDVCSEWLVKLDESAGFNEADLNQDLKRELHQVESSRTGEGKGEPEH